MIDERLVGTWWIYKRNRSAYSIFKGPSCCDYLSGALPDNACSCWYVPNDEEFQKALWGLHTILLYKESKAETLPISTEGIIFPPEEYIDDNSIIEIEIKSNGDYIIFDSIKI